MLPPIPTLQLIICQNTVTSLNMPTKSQKTASISILEKILFGGDSFFSQKNKGFYGIRTYFNINHIIFSCSLLTENDEQKDSPSFMKDGCPTWSPITNKIAYFHGGKITTPGVYLMVVLQNHKAKYQNFLCCLFLKMLRYPVIIQIRLIHLRPLGLVCPKAHLLKSLFIP